jgi:hypothetical protein
VLGILGFVLWGSNGDDTPFDGMAAFCTSEARTKGAGPV